MIWSVWSWTALIRSALGFFHFALAISISSIPPSTSASIIIVEVVGLHILLFPHQPCIGLGTVPALAGFESNSPPVMEPVGVVRDRFMVGCLFLQLDLGKRDLDPSVLVSPVTDEPVLFIETDFFRIRERMDHDHDLLVVETPEVPISRREGKREGGPQIAEVDQQRFRIHLGDQIIVSQSEDGSDAVILVLNG